MHTISC